VIVALAALLAHVALQPARPDTTPRQPAIVTRAPLDTSAAVNFRVLVAPDTVYVGEQTIYQLGVFLDASVRDRLRRMEAIAPEMRGMMAYDPPAPVAGFASRNVGTRRYEPHVYQRAIFPLTPGRFAIPPARLVYAMPLSYSFFSREESYEVRSDSVVVVALEPPRATRPADWAGAVGTLRVSARVDTAAARVGDPVLLTMRISGRGNVKLFPRPRLDVPWASVVEGGERVALSPDSLDVHGDKEVDWVLTPLRPGRMVIPAIRYPYFDPTTARYVVATTPPIPLVVSPGALAVLDTGAAARPRWSVRSVYRGALPEPPYEGRPFWWLVALAPLPAAALLVAHRPRRRKAPPSAASRLRALAARDAAGGADRGATRDVREVRRAFLAAASARMRLTTLALAEPDALAHAARRAGTSEATAAAAAALLDELNRAAFSAEHGGARDLAARAERVYRAIDAEARTFRTRRTAIAALLVALAAAGAARAAAPSSDVQQFAQGLIAYEHGQFPLAEREFGAVAARVPRAADAWANLGTAAFAAGDTARAALGWEHALRLEPLADDVRDRLESSGIAGAGAGAVPRVPPLPVAIAALALWIAAWLTLAWRLRQRRGRAAAPRAFAIIALALATGAAAAWLDARLAAQNLVVLQRTSPLRLLPALGSERRATVRVGEVARVTEQDGQWAYVVADGGREGWTDRAALASLARD
jgi:hypothetical protein